MRLSSLPCPVLSTPAVAALAATLVSASAGLAADRLHRRGESAPIEGRTVDVNKEGVLFHVSRGPQTGDLLITWDRVQRLETDHEGFAETFEQMRSLSDRLWRARSRIERGDHAAAEPILDSLFAETVHQTGATALIVAEGLLRCRLARGARAAAVIPWLETRRLLNAGLKPTAYTAMRPVIDFQTGLCAQLPPVWTRSVGVEQMLADLGQYSGAAPQVQRLAALYARAARLALGAPIEDAAAFYRSDESWDRDPGVVVATAFVAALERVKPMPADPEKVLARPLREEGPLTPWAFFLRGLARVESADADRRRQGLVDLLTIPAMHREANAYLAGFAIERAAAVLEQMGRAADAASLRAELKREDPTHPLHDARPGARVAVQEKQP